MQGPAHKSQEGSDLFLFQQDPLLSGGCSWGVGRGDCTGPAEQWTLRRGQTLGLSIGRAPVGLPSAELGRQVEGSQQFVFGVDLWIVRITVTVNFSSVLCAWHRLRVIAFHHYKSPVKLV